MGPSLLGAEFVRGRDVPESFGCMYGVFKFLVVGMDVRSMNEVCNLTALGYIFIYILMIFL